MNFGILPDAMSFKLPESSFRPKPPPERENIAESLLVRQAINGDTEAFARLYQLYYQQLVALIFSYTKDFDIAEELAQQAFINAQKKLPSYKDKGHRYGTYLKRIAVNLAINHHNRVEKRRSQSTLESALHAMSVYSVSGQDLPQRLVDEELLQHLYRAMQALPQDQQRVVRLKLETNWQMTNLEIGDKIGKSESAVKSLYLRALEKLQNLIMQLQG